jgi:CPA2 family monovalent cation:H+ antiporter-2
MTDIPLTTVLNFVLFLGIPFIVSYFIQKAKISPTVGYLLGGVILINFFGRFFSVETINNLAYFGIIFLLFTIGLELNFSRIFSLKRLIIIGGILQITLSIFFIVFLSFIFGFSLLESFLIGIALSSSSTSLVAKIIEERGEEGTFLGELAMGILMFQDLAFIPFMIIFTSLTAKSLSFFDVSTKIIFGMIEAFLIIFLLFYFGQKILPLVFNKISRTSRELLNFFTILFIFSMIAFSLFFHLPILVTVFVIGVLLGQTLEHHHIFSEIRPLRDLLAIIFFIFVGSHIELSAIFSFLPKIFLFSFLLMLIKALIILIIFIFFRFHSKTAFSLALYLFQIDEDAFILMSTAFANGVVDRQTYLFIVTAVLLTLIITPIMIENKEKIYQLTRDFLKRYFPFFDKFITHKIDRDQSPIDVLSIKDHVIICGYGRVGSFIGRSLLLANIPFLAIDYNFHLVEKAKKEGVNVIYGDPTDIDILDFAQIENAKVLVLTLPERYSQEKVILNAKKLNPKILIIARIHRKIDQHRLKSLGAHITIQPEVEAALSIIKKIYLLNQFSQEEITQKIKRIRLEYEGV